MSCLLITYWVYLLITESPRKHELRTKKGTLWIYGDSVNIFFAQSLMQRKLCRDIFKRCNFSYNWIYPVTNVTAAKKENDDRDYDNERVLQSLRHVLHDPQMDENSAIIMNFGLHFVESTNFTNYKKLIDGLVKVLTDEEKVSTLNVTSPKFRGTVIWKTTTAINKEKASNIHLGHKRFLTQQVKYHLPREDEGWEICILCRPYSQFLLKLFLDHWRFRKPQKGLRTANSVPQSLLTWTVQAVSHLFWFSVGINAMRVITSSRELHTTSKNTFGGIAMSIRIM